MTIKVFYSWQSDINAKYNRYFQLDCLKAAIKKINQEFDLKESIREDHDTKGVPGSPDIATTILSKIESSDIFIGDITFVSFSESGRALSNPNVLIELGYAMHALGDERVINVINTSFGEADGNIPFDLAHKRWPISYELSDRNISDKAEVKKNLIDSFVSALKPYAKQPKVVGPKFASNGEKVKHQEVVRQQLSEYIQKINHEKLRRRVILRDLDRVDNYPEVSDDDGISPWFKVELAQLYHRGVQVFLQAGALSLCEDGSFRFRDTKSGEQGDERVFLVGEIPFVNIETINFDGDEYDYFPHIFCHFSEKNQEPYERLIFCKEIDMGHGYKHYSEIETLANVQENSKKYGLQYFA
ncbi:MAG: hypothetical protein ACI6PR_08285 [Pseudoalteromonas sp.]|uniref:hypothetical protein n=1 Tax=Pseudoalteromonas sp. TaxID=53249 RepID=UPI003850EC02